MRSPWFPAAGRPRGHGERLPGAPWCGVGRSALALSGDDGGGGAEAWLVKCFNKEVANHNEAPRNFHGLFKFTAYDSEVILANARLEMVIGHDRPWLKEDLWTNQYVPRKWDTHQGLKNRAPTEPQDLQGTECHRTRRRRPTGVTSPTWQTATRPLKRSSDCCEEITHDHWNIIYESGFFRFFHGDSGWFKPGCHTGCQNKPSKVQVFQATTWLIHERIDPSDPRDTCRTVFTSIGFCSPAYYRRKLPLVAS